MIRTLSYTELSTAMTCLHRWDLAYSDRLAGSSLRSRSIAPILSDGRAWGAGAATYHAHGSELLANMEAHAALYGSLGDDFDEMRQAGVPVAADALTDRYERLSEILADYVERTEVMALTRLEGPLDVALPSRGGKRSSTHYRFTGRIDGWLDDIHGHRWVVEFKFRRALTPAWLIALQQQTKWYAWALGRDQGDETFPMGVLVDERLAEAPAPARVLKNGRPSVDRSQMTTGALYREACADTDTDVDEEVAAALDARQWQQRVPIIFRPGELAEASRELVGLAKLILALDRGDVYPVRNASRAHCQGCGFRDICADPADRHYVDSLFTREPAKRDRVPALEAAT